VQAAVIVIALWMSTALIYPLLHRLAVWFVDAVILRRVSYAKLESKIVGSIENIEDVRVILDDVGERLRFALTARNADWSEIPADEALADRPLVTRGVRNAEILVPTVEKPIFKITLEDFAGGRRLLSGDMEMLAAVGVATARRIDALRVTEERYERKNREDKLAKHAAEAQLSALRAQINPHFLFNALTTIGYLIQTTPDKAFQTLMKLTQLLRGVLRTTDEFGSLGDEIKLIENYLDIEKTRFEERLQVTIEVPPGLRKLRVPALILQPLVENAVKHGISEAKKGGEVAIRAELKQEDGESFLILAVEDTGAGFKTTKSAGAGIGLENIRQRLRAHYGRAAALRIEPGETCGARAELKLPVRAQLA
jgi:signal transduction histidine kinase